jgi:hypothetical protein
VKRLLLVVVAAVILRPGAAGAAQTIRVVTTIPDLADMARQVGGDLVDGLSRPGPRWWSCQERNSIDVIDYNVRTLVKAVTGS